MVIQRGLHSWTKTGRTISHLVLSAAVFWAVSSMAPAADPPPDGVLGTPPSVRHYESSKKVYRGAGADRTITWRAWKEAPGGEYRVRTGDRYLGGQVWEHYLGFEQRPGLDKSIKLFMIRLGDEDVHEDVIIRPGSRYAILKVTNGTMTAHKGLWTWSVQ
jgi:hypothetical protein